MMRPVPRDRQSATAARWAIVDDATMTTSSISTDRTPGTALADAATPGAPDDPPAPLVLFAADDASVCIDDACLPPEETE
jgi:hypothetical protein